jgi:hypothetical protein
MERRIHLIDHLISKSLPKVSIYKHIKKMSYRILFNLSNKPSINKWMSYLNDYRSFNNLVDVKLSADYFLFYLTVRRSTSLL